MLVEVRHIAQTAVLLSLARASYLTLAWHPSPSLLSSLEEGSFVLRPSVERGICVKYENGPLSKRCRQKQVRASTALCVAEDETKRIPAVACTRCLQTLQLLQPLARACWQSQLAFLLVQCRVCAVRSTEGDNAQTGEINWTLYFKDRSAAMIDLYQVPESCTPGKMGRRQFCQQI